jgi:hypothetical protein
MAVVLVEGDDMLPDLLSSTNVSTARPESPSPSGTTSSAMDPLAYNTHRNAIAASSIAILAILVLASV